MKKTCIVSKSLKFGLCISCVVWAATAPLAAANELYAASTTESTPQTGNVVTNYHGGLGVGVILGEPTGFTMKYWLARNHAFDLGAAWAFEPNGYFELYGDYLFHFFDLIKVPRGELPFYVGVGARVAIPDAGSTLVGVRIPVGLAYEFEQVPVEVFVEIAPIVDVAPSTELRWNGGIGVRYYFR
jgi:hypothetical protein